MIHCIPFCKWSPNDISGPTGGVSFQICLKPDEDLLNAESLSDNPLSQIKN